MLSFERVFSSNDYKLKLSVQIQAVNDSSRITDDLKAHISRLSENGSTLIQCTYGNTIN